MAMVRTVAARSTAMAAENRPSSTQPRVWGMRRMKNSMDGWRMSTTNRQAKPHMMENSRQI